MTRLGFDVNDKGLKRAEKGIASFKRNALQLAGLTIAAGAGIFAIAKNAANFGEELLATSQKVGITVESLQRLRYAAQLSEVSQEELSSGIRFLSRNLYEAQKGSKEAASAFKALKIDPKKLKDPEQALLAMSDTFAKMPNGIEKTALAVKIFGRGGLAMIPMLNQGRAGILGMTKEVEDLGLIFGTDAAKASDQFNDNLFRLQYILSLSSKMIGKELLPLITSFIGKLIAWAKANKDLIRQKTKEYAKKLIDLMWALWKISTKVVSVLGKITDALGGVENTAYLVAAALATIYAARVIVAIGQIATGFYSVAASLKAVNVAALLIPGAIAIIVGGIGLIIDAAVRGKASLLDMFGDWLMDKWPAFRKFIDFLALTVVNFQLAWRDGWIEIQDVFVRVVGFMTKVWEAFKTNVLSQLSLAVNFIPIIGPAIGPIKKAVDYFQQPNEQPGGSPAAGQLKLPDVTAWSNMMMAARASMSMPIVGGMGENVTKNQTNTFNIQNRTEVKVETNADATKIGDETAKKAEAASNRSARAAARALEGVA